MVIVANIPISIPKKVLEPMPLYNNSAIGSTYVKLDNTRNHSIPNISVATLDNQILQNIILDYMDQLKLEKVVFLPYNSSSIAQRNDIRRNIVNNNFELIDNSFGVCVYVDGILSGHIIGITVNNEIIIYHFQVYNTMHATAIAHFLLLIFKFQFCLHTIVITVDSNSYDASEILTINQFRVCRERSLLRNWHLYSIEPTLVCKLTIPDLKEINSFKTTLIVK